MMNREQIDALVSQYLDAELHEVEQRFATNAWKVNDHGEHGDWNTVAQSLLADENEKAEQALQCNELQSTLGDAKAMLQGGPEDAIAVLARRLLAVRHEALWAEAKGVAG